MAARLMGRAHELARYNIVGTGTGTVHRKVSASLPISWHELQPMPYYFYQAGNSSMDYLGLWKWD